MTHGFQESASVCLLLKTYILFDVHHPQNTRHKFYCRHLTVCSLGHLYSHFVEAFCLSVLVVNDDSEMVIYLDNFDMVALALERLSEYVPRQLDFHQFDNEAGQRTVTSCGLDNDLENLR